MKRWETFKSSNQYKVWRKLIHRKVAAIGLVICAIILFLVIFGDLISPYNPQKINTVEALQPPGAAHWFGTDEMGRDVFSRVIYGARLTMAVSVVAVAIALVAGTALGLVSGYIGGGVDLIISKFIEALSAFPMIMFALTITAILGPGLKNVMIAIGVAYIPAFARIVRGMTLTVREREYIENAVSIGLNRFEILIRYVLPNVSSVIIVQASLAALC
jgi:peptide/nickel transport system permease protein